jgi:sigma-E factor negative regulatory protein RseC
MADKQIAHEGIVEESDGQRVRIRITADAACADCHARGACSIAEEPDKTLILPLSGAPYARGQKVKVILERSLGFRALFLGYVFPFLLVVAILLLMTGLSADELTSGLVSLSVLIPYYVILRIFRDRIDKKFEFKLSL